MFEVRAEFVILAGTFAEVMAGVVGMVRARVIDMFGRRAVCVVLAGFGVVAIARVVWDSVLSVIIDDSKAVVIQVSDTFVVLGPSVTVPL